jgi:pyruvate kinase
MKIKPVKIVATLGPATHSYEKIEELVKAGVDVFRFTLAHAASEEVAEAIGWIREVEEKLNKPIAVMGDLPGPKIRISDIKPETVLTKGQKFIVSKTIKIGDKHGCGINQPSVLEALEPGAEVFIDDGTIKLVIDKKIDEGVETTVIAGGLLNSRKGFSAEGLSLNTQVITDKESIELMVGLQADALAVSFVQTKNDIEIVKDLLPTDSKIMIIAKIETADGVSNAEEILEAADGMMIARGDLGLAVPIAKVPLIQKQLIALCVKNAKPVITATQMLESMISKPMPTRAEVGDIANTILDRTDAIMLSAETAVGKFPVDAVEMMGKIIAEVVAHVSVYEYKERKTIGNAITDAAGNIADLIEAKLIIVFTESGRTARRISRHRHQQSIIAISPNPITIRKLSFTWGVYQIYMKELSTFEGMLEKAREIAKTNAIKPLSEGDKYVVSAGMPYGQSGSTNMILAQKV